VVRGVILIACVLALAGTAHAEEGRLLGDDTFAVPSHGPLLLDGGLLVAMPSVLPAGMTTGVGAGITRECSCWWSYGARAAWSQLTSSDMVWTVAHQEYRLRADAAVRHSFGRGTLALRLDLGTTIIHEDRIRNQSTHLPPAGALESKAIAAVPAGELEAVVSLHIAGPWLFVVSGGPAADIYNGGLRGGWIAQLGVGWQP
jgi:hypothetical protein